MKIGNIKIKNGIFLAPMAGYTDRAMRLIAREFGCEYTTTEMVSARAVTYGDQKTFRLGRIYDDEGPVALQLFDKDPSVMAEAAGIILRHEEELRASGRKHESLFPGISEEERPTVALPVAFDINMGCPVNKIFSNGTGSALMRDPDLIYRITKAVNQATPLPTTVKMRLGIDSEHINVMECAKAAEEGGAAAICIHGRTKAQMYGGVADFKEIARVKSSLSIPVIANGDINSPEAARVVLDSTAADGIAIGRGAVGNPYIFRDIINMLEGRVPSAAPTTEMLIEVALRQLRYAVEDKGEVVAIPESRKQIALYLKGFRGAARIRTEINTSLTLSGVEAALRTAISD